MRHILDAQPSYKPAITAETATRASGIAVGFHMSTLNHMNICPGGSLSPGKTLLMDSELSAICSKCTAAFLFDQYTMQWIKQVE